MLTEFILPGIVVGAGAALSPGPILILTISETLRGGLRSGFSVAIVPSILDMKFVPISIVFAGAIASYSPLIGILSLAGGAFLLYLAYRNVCACPVDISRPVKASSSMMQAIIADFLNPYLYIFWFSVAIPVFAKGNLTGSIIFAITLSISTFIGHFGLSILVTLVRTRLLGYLHWIIRLLSIPLLIVAVMFFQEGIRLLYS